MPNSHAQLQTHPIAPCPWVESLIVGVTKASDTLSIIFQLSGDLSKIVRPAEPSGQRRDELWKTTCFELFVRRQGSDQYQEFNFALNGDWAAYQFESYRTNRVDLLCPEPAIDVIWKAHAATIQIDLKLPTADVDKGPMFLGPAVILEDIDGVRSFWAIHHALNKPDFHHIDTFKMTLD